jgi:formate hydrogenlyase subunit 3/multisubunit Na+/H+ antiporter MnhD subunit
MKIKHSLDATIRYIVLSIFSTAFFLLGISFLYALTGNVLFSSLSFIKGIDLYFVSILFLIGLSIRALLFPFQFWAPDIYQTSAHINTAFFSGVLNKIGIIAIIRFLISVPQISGLVTILAIITMFYGNITAAIQKNLKRLLAYSSIAHIGYILLSISFLTEKGISAGIFHFFNHGFVVIPMFLIAGMIIDSFGSANLEKLKYLGSKNKSLLFLFSFPLFALLGIPGFSMFISELLIFISTYQSSSTIFIFLIINMTISLIYYLKIAKNLYIHKKKTDAKKIPISIFSWFSILFFCVITFLNGIYPIILDFIIDVSRSLL